ncbi:uncharacterized protein LOC117115155 [Anneissia japonica]|uniref:uncharacterized protein LOC117115155 n=1 Tax=Anneissia japonica TaxID=1529436 RepID=UPI0014259F5E|nr:uncharacterized protein LOC117115155 [Anneissia japonica]
MANQQPATTKTMTGDQIPGSTGTGLTFLQLAPTSNMAQQFAPTTPSYQQIPQLQLVQGQQMLPYPTLYLQQSGANMGQQIQQFHLIQHPTTGQGSHQLMQLLQTPQSTNHQFAAGQLSQQLQLVQQPQLILVPQNQFVGSTPQTPQVLCGAPGSSMLPTLLLMHPNSVKQQLPVNTKNTNINSEDKGTKDNQENQSENPCAITLPTSDSVRDFAAAAVASTPLEETTKLMKTISLDNSYSYLNYNPDMEAVLENTLFVSCGTESDAAGRSTSSGIRPSSPMLPCSNYGCKIRQLNHNCKRNRLEPGPVSEDEQALSDDSSTTFTHDQHLHGVWMSYDDDRMFRYKPITADRSSDETATSIGSEDEIDSSHTAIQDDEARYNSLAQTDEAGSQNDAEISTEVENSCETQYQERPVLDSIDVISPYPNTKSSFGAGSNSSEGQKDSAFETSDSNSEKSSHNGNQISLEAGPPHGNYQSSQQTTGGSSKCNPKKGPKASSKQTVIPKNKLNPSSLQVPRDSKRKSVSPTPVSKFHQQTINQRKTISPATRNFKASGRPCGLKAGIKVTLPLRKAGTKTTESTKPISKFGGCRVPTSNDCRSSGRGDAYQLKLSKRGEEDRPRQI